MTCAVFKRQGQAERSPYDKAIKWYYIAANQEMPIIVNKPPEAKKR